MHHALLLPEIVSNVLDILKDLDGSLYPCLFVNQLFYSETCRILWQHCQPYNNSPTMEDFVRIVKQNSNVLRAQCYANLIQTIDFTLSSKITQTQSGIVIAKSPITELLGCFRGLRFSHLQKFRLNDRNAMIEVHDINTITGFIQPKLKDLWFHGVKGLSDLFLDCLAVCHLTDLALHRLPGCTITQKGWIHFLRSMHSLQSLQACGIECWSSEAFGIVSRMTQLEYFSLIEIQHEWTQHCGSFPKLRKIFTKMSDEALNGLWRVNQHIEELTLELQNVPLSSQTRIFVILSQFSCLKQLAVELGAGYDINWQDLITVGRLCSELEDISINVKYLEDPCGLTDELLEAIVANLINLEYLRLYPWSPNVLSWLSIKAISHYCKKLRSLEIYCNISWSELLNETEEIQFPALWSFSITVDRSNRVQELSEQEISRITSRFLGMMPMLEDFHIYDGNDVDSEVERSVRELTRNDIDEI